jgi:hypothetical protein
MNDPVTIQDGNTFERVAITEWLEKNNTSPIDRSLIVDKRLYSNINLKIIIKEFMENNQDSIKKESELDMVLEERITSKTDHRNKSNITNPLVTITYLYIPGWNVIQRVLSSSINPTPRIAIEQP